MAKENKEATRPPGNTIIWATQKGVFIANNKEKPKDVSSISHVEELDLNTITPKTSKRQLTLRYLGSQPFTEEGWRKYRSAEFILDGNFADGTNRLTFEERKRRILSGEGYPGQERR